MLRAIRDVQPRCVLEENVRGLITQQGGVVFEQVCASMEALGYEVQPFILPACAVNAPHRRDGVWIVAHRADAGVEEVRERQDGVHAAFDASDSERCRGTQVYNKVQSKKPNGERSYSDGDKWFDSDPERKRMEESGVFPGGEKKEQFSRINYSEISDFIRFATESPVCSGDDGLSARLDAITFPKWREQSIKAYGNAVVPQVVYRIFRTIEDYEKITEI